MSSLGQPLPSLLIEQEQREGAQLALFALPEDVEASLDLQGQYTAARLFLRRPDTYRTVVRLLTEKQSVRAIKRACAVHHNTIAAVAERERIPIDTQKEQVIGKLRLLQDMLVDSMIDHVAAGTMKAEALPVAFGIATDKLELLSGGVTARIETVSTDGPVTWDAWKEAALKKVTGRDVTGLGVEESEQRAARVHRLAQPSDGLSEGSLVEPPNVAGVVAEPTAPAPDDEGGRGSDFRPGGAGDTTG